MLTRIVFGLVVAVVFASGAVAGPALTEGELDLLRSQLARCYSPPLGWTDPAQVRVVLLLSLNADGSLDGLPQILETPQGAFSAAAPESALDAAFRCAPFTLPADKYEAWRRVRVTFDPSEFVPLAPTPGVANNLALSGNDRWVAVASRQDLNEAISIAKAYSGASRVVRSQNGWFAVVLGPYATTDIGSFRQSYLGQSLPPDAMLTRGSGYVETVWQSPSETLAPSVAASSPEGPHCEVFGRGRHRNRAATGVQAGIVRCQSGIG